MELKIEYVGIDTIKPYAKNAKLHPEEQVEQIKKSIQDYGMNDPIAVWNNEIVEGHGRLMACKELGMETVPIIRLDDLTDDQRREYMLVHNKTTMNSDFDFEILTEELVDLPEFDAGFYDFEVDFDEDNNPVKEDEAPEPPAEPKMKPGVLVKLGRHRLLCGDATSVDDLETLMGGVQSGLISYGPALQCSI